MDMPPRLDWPEACIGPGLEVPPARRVTRANWRTYPFNRWAFQHTRELVPSRALVASCAARPLETHEAGLDRLRFEAPGGRVLSLADYEAETFADGLIVLWRGAIVRESYSNGMTPATPHHAFSVTKSFVGLIAEMLTARGLLDPDAPATEYVPELSGSAFGPARVRHLLDMTDGAAFDEDYANPDADVHLYSAAYWKPEAARGGARETLARLSRRDHPPGRGFSYRTPVADALGWVIARASGKRLATLFEELLWHPAGCAGPGHFLVDVAGDEIAASGLNASLRDLARLALLFLEGTPAIPAAARASILEGGNPGLFENSRYAERLPGSYRSQWWIGGGARKSASAIGVYGQRVYLEPESGFGFIRLGSYPTPSNQPTDALHAAAIAAVRAHLGKGG